MCEDKPSDCVSIANRLSPPFSAPPSPFKHFAQIAREIYDRGDSDGGDGVITEGGNN